MTRKPCTVMACPDVAIARGLCVTHYFRWYRHGSAFYQPHQFKPRARLQRLQVVREHATNA